MRIGEFGQTEFCRDSLPYAAEGIGSKEALPFLRYIRHHVWKQSRPHLSLGIVSTVWALRYACEVNPGLANPLAIGVVEAVNGSPTARLLDASEMTTHTNLINEIEHETLGRLFAPPGAAKPPPIPKPPTPQRRRQDRR
jgi:hypothetical protein